MKFTSLALTKLIALCLRPWSDHFTVATAFVASPTLVGHSRGSPLRPFHLAVATSSNPATATSLDDVVNFPELGPDGIYHIQTPAQHK